MLQFLNKRVDPDDEHHIVRMRDCFSWRKHLCLVFELLSVNLYELLKHNHFKGLSLGLLTIFIAQVLYLAKWQLSNPGRWRADSGGLEAVLFTFTMRDC